MREIDEFLDEVFEHYRGDQKEIISLKLEMKNHLVESVHELEAAGVSHQESIRIARERFGDPKCINKELPEVLIFSRRKFYKQLIISSGIVAAVIIVLIVNLIFSNINIRKNNDKLAEAQAVKEVFTQELFDTHGDSLSNSESMIKIAKLMAAYCNTGKLSKNLNAKHNIDVIDEIDEMNKIFKYHNGVLIAIAVIASETDYECPYFQKIAQLGVMRLSDSVDVIKLAERAYEAKTEEDYQYIENQIQLYKEGADFSTYEEALNYNNQLG